MAIRQRPVNDDGNIHIKKDTTPCRINFKGVEPIDVFVVIRR